MVWRGPRAKNQLALSVRPSGWQAAHEFQAWPASDQRPSPVAKNFAPRLTALSVPGPGGSVAGTAATAVWVPKLSTDRLRLFSLIARAKETVAAPPLALAMPTGSSPAATAPPGLRLMNGW